VANKQGNPNLKAVRNKDTAAANRARSKRADDYVLSLAPLLREFTRQGFTRYRMAQELNAQGKVTSRGKAWSPMAVGRVFKRLQVLHAKGVRLSN
jgi:hypothetical protein